MAWGTKYRITFKDIEDTTYQILIQEDNYASTITDLTPGATPLRMVYAGYEKNQSIVGSRAEIQVLYESVLDDLFVEADRAFRVYILSDFLWWGYLVPFQYYRKLGGSPHYATFIATDQLGLLSEKKFEDSSGDPVFYINTDMSHFQAAVDQTGLDLPTREGVNIYDTNFDDDPEDSPLTQVYSYPEQYWDEVNNERTDCHTVLTDLLKKYNARICQWDLQWWIQRPQTLWSEHTTRYFSAAGSYLSNTIASRKYVMQDEGAKWRANPEITKLPRAGRVEVKAEPKRLDNAFKNSTFDYFTQNGDGGVPRYWTQASPITEQDGYLDMGSTTTGATNHLHTTVQYPNVATVRLIVEFQAVWHATNTEAKLNFKIYSPISLEDYTTSGWSTGGGNYIFDVYAATSGVSMTEYAEISIEIPPTSEVRGLYDSVKVELHDLKVDTTTTDSTVYIRSVRLEVDYRSSSATEFPYSAENDIDSSFVIRESLKQCDADNISYDYFRGIWPLDTYYYLQKSATLNDNIYQWHIIGNPDLVATPESIQQLYTTQLLEASYAPLDQIRGTLKGDYDYTKALVDTDLVDSYGFAKTFVGQDLVYDCRKNEWTGTWIEVAPIYEDETATWSGINYMSWDLDGAELSVDNQTTSGTDFARTTAYTAVAGEMVRFKMTLVDDGSSALPNYDFDSNTGELEWGDNYLEFRCDTAGSYYLEVNHTDGETAHFTATYEMYSLTGI